MEKALSPQVQCLERLGGGEEVGVSRSEVVGESVSKVIKGKGMEGRACGGLCRR